MPHYPASWVVDTWKPIGGCAFTGSPVALTGNSAFRFCLLMQWHTIATDPLHTPRGGGTPVDPDLEPFEPPQETNEELLVRQLLQAATDQHSQECGSQAAGRYHLSLPEFAKVRAIPVCTMEYRCQASRNPRSVGDFKAQCFKFECVARVQHTCTTYLQKVSRHVSHHRRAPEMT